MKLSEVNLNDLDAFERGCPHDMFEVLRREAPVFWQDEPYGSGYWAITKYEDVKHISRHPIEFSSERQGSLIRDPDPGALAFIQQVMLSMDPPKHRNYRSLVNKAFTPRMVDGMRPRIAQMCRQIVNGVIEKGECDFVEELAAPLPMLVITRADGRPRRGPAARLRDRQQDGRLRRSRVPRRQDAPDEDEGERREHAALRADVHLRGEAAREGALPSRRRPRHRARERGARRAQAHARGVQLLLPAAPDRGQRDDAHRHEQRDDQPDGPPRSAARAEAGHVAARRRGRGDPALLARRSTRSGAPPRSPPRSAARRSPRTRS